MRGSSLSALGTRSSQLPMRVDVGFLDGQSERISNSAFPGAGQFLFNDTQPLVGMHEAIIIRDDPDMFGDGVRPHAKQNEVARSSIRGFNLAHHASGTVCEHFMRPGFTPVPAVRRNRKRLGSYKFAPESSHQSKAVASDPAKACLLMVGCSLNTMQVRQMRLLRVTRIPL